MMENTALPISGNSLKEERDRFVAFAFASADLLLEIDNNYNIRYIDGAIIGFLGEHPQQLIGRSLYSIIAEEEQQNVTEALHQIATKGRANQFRTFLQTKLYKSLPVTLAGATIPHKDNALFITITILTKEIDDELQQRDIKSGLFKKHDFAKQATKRIEEATKQGKNTKLTLLDFPELKEFLDSLEPTTAAELTIEIADYIRSKSLGGDTAGIVKEGVYSVLHDASVTTEQLLTEVQAITKKLDPQGKGVQAKAATIDGNIGNLTGQDSANAILYALNKFAKAGDKFDLESIEQGYAEMLNDTMEKISSFKKTVTEDSFQLAFQPIVELKHGIIHHYETLVRFDSDKFDNPFHFINFGEQTDLISDFDLAMCQRTIDVLKNAAKQHHYPRVAINLSGRSLSSQLFMDALKRLLDTVPKHKKQIIFEITESAKIDDMEKADNFLQSLRDDGHKCCLDDFGVGESSFEYLRTLSVDFVKIDGSYVRETLNSKKGKNMLRAITGMCRHLGIITIGEMIEDEKTAAILWESGIHFGQGYLFGKPTLDAGELVNCDKQSIYYAGAFKSKRKISEAQKRWWLKSENN